LPACDLGFGVVAGVDDSEAVAVTDAVEVRLARFRMGSSSADIAYMTPGKEDNIS
jgi:hypothetical protein